MPDIKLLLFNQPQQDSGLKNITKPSVTFVTSDLGKPAYTEHELERMRQCGNLFDRRSVIKQDILEEFFRKEPCLYSIIFVFF